MAEPDKKKKRMEALSLKKDNTRTAPPHIQKPDFRFGSKDRKNIEKHVDKRHGNDIKSWGFSSSKKSHRKDVKSEFEKRGRVSSYGRGQLHSEKKGLDEYPIKKKKQYKRKK